MASLEEQIRQLRLSAQQIKGSKGTEVASAIYDEGMELRRIFQEKYPLPNDVDPVTRVSPLFDQLIGGGSMEDDQRQRLEEAARNAGLNLNNIRTEVEANLVIAVTKLRAVIDRLSS